MSYIQLRKIKKTILIDNHGKRCLVNAANHFEPVTSSYNNHKKTKEPTRVIYQAELDRLDIERGENEGMK